MTTPLTWLLGDVAPGLGDALAGLLWLLPVAGLLFGLWLGARARGWSRDRAQTQPTASSGPPAPGVAASSGLAANPRPAPSDGDPS